MKPYEHASGTLGPEHFDGDPIEKELTPEQQKQADATTDNVVNNLRAEQERRLKEQQELQKQQAQNTQTKKTPKSKT